MTIIAPWDEEDLQASSEGEDALVVADLSSPNPGTPTSPPASVGPPPWVFVAVAVVALMAVGIVATGATILGVVIWFLL